jgi:hypothetical protein
MENNSEVRYRVYFKEEGQGLTYYSDPYLELEKAKEYLESRYGKDNFIEGYVAKETTTKEIVFKAC